MMATVPDLALDTGSSSDLSLGIDAIIADLAAKQARLSAYIDGRLESGEVTPSEVVRLLSTHGQNAARLGRLLRDRQALGGPALDALAAAVNQALDELSTELGIDL